MPFARDGANWFVYIDNMQLKTRSKVHCLALFPLRCPNKPRLNINVFICYVSTISSQTYAWSFVNDAESCRTNNNNDMIRQEV